MKSVAKEYLVKVEGNQFQVCRLPVKASLRGLKLLGASLVPALAGAASEGSEQNVSEALRQAVEGLDSLPELFDLFVANAKVYDEDRNGFLALGPFAEDVFCGAPDQVLLFLFECVKGEYGNFLKGEGPLSKLLGEAVAKVTTTPASSPKQ